MRKKVDTELKREHIIGIKVKKITKSKIQYLSEAEAKPMSTFINEVLEEYLETYAKYHKIDWEDLLNEKEGL